jgi:hypothetical protein
MRERAERKPPPARSVTGSTGFTRYRPRLTWRATAPITSCSNSKLSGQALAQHEQMSIIAKGLSEEDISDLAAWYASIKVTAEMPQ